MPQSVNKTDDTHALILSAWTKCFNFQPWCSFNTGLQNLQHSTTYSREEERQKQIKIQFSKLTRSLKWVINLFLDKDDLMMLCKLPVAYSSPKSSVVIAAWCDNADGYQMLHTAAFKSCYDSSLLTDSKKHASDGLLSYKVFLKEVKTRIGRAIFF